LMDMVTRNDNTEPMLYVLQQGWVPGPRLKRTLERNLSRYRKNAYLAYDICASGWCCWGGCFSSVAERNETLCEHHLVEVGQLFAGTLDRDSWGVVRSMLNA